MSKASVNLPLNPGAVIIVWLVCVIMAQSLDGVALLATLAVLGLVAVVRARTRSGRLIRRVRVLLLAIVVLFCGFTPGEALLVDLPLLSPSREGMTLAFEHGGRLLCAVLYVALLMELLPHRALIAGVHTLLSPFLALGVPAGRIAVRTMLVLQYVEAAAPRQWRDWLVAEDPIPAPVRFEAVRWSGLDRAVAAGAMVVVGLVMF